MNKNDKIIVAILALLMVAWFWNSRNETQRIQKEREQFFKEHPELAVQQQTPAAQSAAGETAAQAAAPAVLESAQPAAEPVVEKPAKPEELVTVETELASYTFTSKGGGLKNVVLNNFQKTLNEEDGKVELALTGTAANTYGAALSLRNVSGFSAKDDFSVEALKNAEGKAVGVTFTAVNAGGLELVRTVTCTNGYQLAVRDAFRNTSTMPQTLPPRYASLGSLPCQEGMTAAPDMAAMLHFRDVKGKTDTAEQTITDGFAKGQSSFAEMFGSSAGGCSAARVSAMTPMTATAESAVSAVNWLAIRDRFFVVVYTPGTPGNGVTTGATRVSAMNQQNLLLDSVRGEVRYGEVALPAGESMVSEAVLYVGPRQMSELSKMGRDYVSLMSFGTFGFFCRCLLSLLNFIHGFIPNYGWAIIVLTIIVRILLLPLSKKSTDSMRKMQEIQPQLKELQEKYKDDPRKLQQEQMRIYSQNKVNPMSGCLPMLIQLPIFIALFNVLRTSVELRFASFLWISDLSQPENMFAEYLPIGINFLPIAMAVTMTLQSRLTPTAGDPKQQKMMMWMMPIMMLVMCYQFPSALGLYWSVSQAMAIIGLAIARRKGSKGSSSGTPEVEVIPPTRVTRQMKRNS